MRRRQSPGVSSSCQETDSPSPCPMLKSVLLIGHCQPPWEPHALFYRPFSREEKQSRRNSCWLWGFRSSLSTSHQGTVGIKSSGGAVCSLSREERTVSFPSRKEPKSFSFSTVSSEQTWPGGSHPLSRALRQADEREWDGREGGEYERAQVSSCFQQHLSSQAPTGSEHS